MRIVIDGDIALVAEFMLKTVKADRLQEVARSIAQLADLVWEPNYIAKSNKPFKLDWSEDLSKAVLRPQAVSTSPQRESPLES